MNTKEITDFINKLDIIEFTGDERNKLKSMGKDFELIDKILTKIKNTLSNKILTEELSIDFVRGALFTILYFKGIIK